MGVMLEVAALAEQKLEQLHTADTALHIERTEHIVHSIVHMLLDQCLKRVFIDLKKPH